MLRERVGEGDSASDCVDVGMSTGEACRGGNDGEGVERTGEEWCVCGGRRGNGYWSGYRPSYPFCEDEEGVWSRDGGDLDLVKTLRSGVDGHGYGTGKNGEKRTFNENEVRKCVRTLERDERARL